MGNQDIGSLKTEAVSIGASNLEMMVILYCKLTKSAPPAHDLASKR
jgi:hypothetical protein